MRRIYKVLLPHYKREEMEKEESLTNGYSTVTVALTSTTTYYHLYFSELHTHGL